MISRLLKAMAAGLVATVIMTSVMILLAVFGMPGAVNVVLVFSGAMHGLAGLPPSALNGWMAHVAIGTVLWPALYVWLAPRIPVANPAIKAMVFASVAWVVVMAALLLSPAAHLMVAAGGMTAPPLALILHWIYGAVLGPVYAWLTFADDVARAPRPHRYHVDGSGYG